MNYFSKLKLKKFIFYFPNLGRILKIILELDKKIIKKSYFFIFFSEIRKILKKKIGNLIFKIKI